MDFRDYFVQHLHLSLGRLPGFSKLSQSVYLDVISSHKSVMKDESRMKKEYVDNSL